MVGFFSSRHARGRRSILRRLCTTANFASMMTDDEWRMSSYPILGVIISHRYRALEVNTVRNPSRIFEKGLFFEQFDEKFHVQSYIQCDNTRHYDQKKLWELRSRHIDWRCCVSQASSYSGIRLAWTLFERPRLITLDRTVEGTYFRSDERMTRYFVSNSRGSFEKTDIAGKGDTITSSSDTVKAAIRPQVTPTTA